MLYDGIPLLEGKPELTTVIMRLVMNCFPMSINDGLANIKPEANTAFIKSAALIRLVESVKYMLGVLGRNYLTLII